MHLYPLRNLRDASLYHPERRERKVNACASQCKLNPNSISKTFLRALSRLCTSRYQYIAIIYCGRRGVPPSPLTPSQPESPILLSRRLAAWILITQSDVRQRGLSDWLAAGGRWVCWPIGKRHRRGLWILNTLRNRTPWRLPSNSVVGRLIFISKACAVVGLEKAAELWIQLFWSQRETVTAWMETQ